MSDPVKKFSKIVAIISAFIGVCLFLSLGTWFQGTQAPWYSVIPPLVAVFLAFTTQRVLPSLGIAIVVGGFLASVPKAPTEISAWGKGAANTFNFVFNSVIDPTNLQILGFVALIMMTISVMIYGGGLQAVVNLLMRFAKGRRSAQVITALCGLLIFIDDYANTMIVGGALRPLTDRHRISREKLAFLVDATAAPVAGLAIISTWIGYEVGLFGEVAGTLGIARDGYSMFFDALGFRFYCILMIIFVMANVIFGVDFGPMARAEQRALQNGELSDPNASPMTSKTLLATEPSREVKLRAISAILPISGLFSFLMRMVMTCSIGETNIFPSPICPVRAC